MRNILYLRLYKFQKNFHCCIAFTLANLNDSCVTTFTALILWSDLIKEFCNKVNFLGVLLPSSWRCRNVFYRVKNLQHLTTCMKPAWKILLDLLVNFIVYGNFLAVYNFFDSLAVFVLTGNFCLYGNFFEVILFFYS